MVLFFLKDCAWRSGRNSNQTEQLYIILVFHFRLLAAGNLQVLRYFFGNRKVLLFSDWFSFFLVSHQRVFLHFFTCSFPLCIFVNFNLF